MAYTSRKRSYASYRRGGASRPYRRRNYTKSALARPGRYRIRGKGDYKTFFRNTYNAVRKRFAGPYTGKLAGVGHTIGGTVGELIAPGIGGSIGGALGAGAGYLTDKIFGWGDYQIKKNVLVIPGQAESVPTFGKGSIRITHKEYIGSIITGNGFALASYHLNPGISGSFPWLSNIAANFEQYRWNGIVYNFVSTSSDALNSTNTALGRVVMATDYNAADPKFVSIQQMMGTEFSNVGKPSVNIMHAIECDPDQQPLKLYWVREGPALTDQDIRLYDHGVFQIATDGGQAQSVVVGDLWVTYDVTLCKPVQNNTLGFRSPISHWQLLGCTAAAPLGTDFTPEFGSNLNNVFINGTTIALPPDDNAGRYMILYRNKGGTSATLSDPSITYNNCQNKGLYGGGSAGVLTNAGVNDDIYIMSFFVDITARNPTIVFGNNGVYPGTFTNADLFVMQVPTDLV